MALHDTYETSRILTWTLDTAQWHNAFATAKSRANQLSKLASAPYGRISSMLAAMDAPAAGRWPVLQPHAGARGRFTHSSYLLQLNNSFWTTRQETDLDPRPKSSLTATPALLSPSSPGHVAGDGAWRRGARSNMLPVTGSRLMAVAFSIKCALEKRGRLPPPCS
jgi:hypothetical protein